MRRPVTPLLIVLAMATGVFGAAAADLTRYVGKYPFDKVGGRSLYQIAELKSDFIAKFGARRWATLQSYQTAGPVETLDDGTLGKIIFTWQCKPHDCLNSATILLSPDASVLGACFTLAARRGDPKDVEWLGPRWRVEAKNTTCDSNAAEQVASFKRAESRR